MEINTRGEEKVLNEDLVIHFPGGLLGFENLKDYRLFNSETEENLYWLKPVDDEVIEFAVTTPQIYQVDYEISLDDKDESQLDIDEGDELAVLVTLSKNTSSQENSTLLNANFIAPILINMNKKLGMQKILNKQQNPVTITMKG